MKKSESVSKTQLPASSMLSGGNFDYVDSYATAFESQNLTIETVGKAFLSSAPPWVGALMALRNKIVGVFGLKTSNKVTNRQELFDNFRCEPGQRLGLFKVFQKRHNEVILGEDDKHLNFRVSLLLNPSNHSKEHTLTISTTVQFHNWLGRLYFIPVRPFHQLIVPSMLRGIIRQIK